MPARPNIFHRCPFRTASIILCRGLCKAFPQSNLSGRLSATGECGGCIMYNENATRLTQRCNRWGGSMSVQKAGRREHSLQHFESRVYRVGWTAAFCDSDCRIRKLCPMMWTSKPRCGRLRHKDSFQHSVSFGHVSLSALCAVLGPCKNGERSAADLGV